ncbi:MAG: hypothetical protein VKO00_09875 [Cyanobacteriota bacterium]|nr:hypothetical protein [Cyanobacteriota bacterium]
MTAEPESAPSPLPAPYRSPWGELAANLRAVVADLRLRLQELVRRNGEGALPLPPFWPNTLASAFWPIVLALLVVLLVLLGRGPMEHEPAQQEVPPPIATAEAPPAEAPPAEARSEQLPAAEPEPSPLEALFVRPESDGLIVAVRDDRTTDQLVLMLGPAWNQLAEPERQRRSRRWQEQAESLGYGHLCLEDTQDRPLGRTAAVGQGMVLLQPPG